MMQHKHLVIFDVDGTLTQTNTLDSDAYTHTFLGHLGLDEINNNWDDYQYSTDSGMAIELFEKYMQRTPQIEELNQIKQTFFSLLKQKISQDVTCCLPIPGAATVFQNILSLNHWDIAIATGCWLESALIKLKSAGLYQTALPIGCGDDHIERHEIIKTAVERAKNHYRQQQYHEIVYVGDRMWDYQASQKLGIRFIGVGKELFQNNRLNAPVVEHYLTNEFIKYLHDQLTQLQ